MRRRLILWKSRSTAVQKIDWARRHLEKSVSIGGVLAQNVTLDAIGVTKGEGLDGKHVCS